MITIGGSPGTGTTTVSRILAEDLGLEHVYAGDLFREMAAGKGLTIVEFNEYAESHPEVDRDLDALQLGIARKGGIVLEGRMSGFLLHREGIRSFDVWLICDADERARRLSEREDIQHREIVRDMLRREGSERRRYMELYGFDPVNAHVLETTFDMVVDTTGIPAEEVASLIEASYGSWSSGS